MWQGSAKSLSTLPDLNCYESISDFDENLSDTNVLQNSNINLDVNLSISHNVSPKPDPDTNKHFRNSSKNNLRNIPKYVSNCQKRLDYEHFENCITILDDDDYVKLLQSSEDLDNHGTSELNERYDREDTYTKSLLNEFTKNPKSAFGKMYGSNNHSKSTKTTWQQHHCMSQTSKESKEYEQQVPEISLTMSDENSMEEYGDMDFLIIKDQAMSESESGSELDWNSLTPPVPASPSDQRVPETELDLNFYVGDYGNYPATSSSSESSIPSSNASNDQPSHHRYFQPQISFQNIEVLQGSENDQVVPIL